MPGTTAKRALKSIAASNPSTPPTELSVRWRVWLPVVIGTGCVSDPKLASADAYDDGPDMNASSSGVYENVGSVVSYVPLTSASPPRYARCTRPIFSG